jgi:GNAT superfamily N-acetyltransferase
MLLLRDATSNDLPRLQEVFRRSSLSNEGDRAALLDHPEALIFPPASLSNGRVRVAIMQGDLIVGFATTVAKVGFLELDDLFTDPDWKRRGVATTLVDDVVAFATTIGIARISVIANPHAAPFYQHAGFVAEGTVSTDFGEALRMHLTVRS